MIATYAKAIAATIGGLVPATVVGYFALIGIDLDVTVVAGVLAVLSPLASLVATLVSPANATPVATGKHAAGNMSDGYMATSEADTLAQLQAEVADWQNTTA